MADQLAGFGYAVLVPDVYYRDGDWAPFEMATVFSDPERAQAAVRHDLQGDTGDHGQRRRRVLRLPGVAARGQAATRSAPPATAWAGGRRWWSPAGCPSGWPRRCPSTAAAWSTDDAGSPHLLADRMRATVYVGGAENDESFTAEHGETLDKALTAAGVEHTIEFYSAAHGFAVPDNAPYDAAAAERHWDAMKELFGSRARLTGRPLP